MSNDAKRDAAVLRLGKKIVAELGLRDGTDTLSKWVAHDIAELIYDAEASGEANSSSARATCRNAIMALWKHRAGASERFAHIGTLQGWTRFLRSRGNPFLNFDADRLKVSEDKSEAELCLAFASTLRDATDPMIRAALHLAAQYADPTIEKDASTMALAQLETEESKAARILIGWSKGQVNRTAEMKVEIEKTIAQLNAAAKFLLEAIEGLSAEEVGPEIKGS
jgi:hypothetical protein